MITIIDYKSGNLASLSNALKTLKQQFVITSDPAQIKKATKIIFPGVGRAGEAMTQLKKLDLISVIQKSKVPFLGICLGMQILLPFSEEDNVPCLSVFPGRVKHFNPKNDLLKVPQIGWNKVQFTNTNDPLLKNIPDESYFYFIHSYFVDTEEKNILGQTNYGQPFSAIIKKNNFYGVQFHPEKSGKIGLRLLENFCSLRNRPYLLNPKSYNPFFVIPAIDLIDGKCVRLNQGDYTKKKIYSSSPLKMAKQFGESGASWIHIIDLDGAKKGTLINQNTILKIAKKIPINVQAGGGIRTYGEAVQLLSQGVSRIILSTAALASPVFLQTLLNEYGSDRLIISLDLKNGQLKTDGWQKTADKNLKQILTFLKGVGIKTIICTDISRDGTLQGPNYQTLKIVIKAGFSTIIAGGISQLDQITKLKQMGASGVIIGKALYEGKIKLEELFNQRGTSSSNLTKRIIPCLDIKNGRVVKGTNFKLLKDAGDPVKLAKYYSNFGADELVFLDITATIEQRKLLFTLVKKIAAKINIPFTVGGGIKDLKTIRSLLQAGADKISLGTAAVTNSSLVQKAAAQFGSQCIVISLDVKKEQNNWRIYIKGGRKPTTLNAISFAKKMEKLGAGELLVNSLDKDGTGRGYDLELLNKISTSVKIPVIASSGAGRKEHFLQAFNQGKVDAVLAASLFHYGKLTIPDLKTYLLNKKIPIRL